MADFDSRIDTAIDESIRWATPGQFFARHAVVDTEVGETTVKADEKLALFCCSAHRDAAVFDAPHEFRLDRTPKNHLGFGSGGTHFCLGSQLARMEQRSLFFDMQTRLPTVALGTREYSSSSTLHGIKRMSIRRADRRGRLATRSK